MDRQLHASLLRFRSFFIFAILALSYGITICSATAPKEADSANTEPALLVVSYDAFRPEYLQRGVTPYMNTFRKEGASTEFMYNVFPTKTFPNHHTLATVSSCVHALPSATIQIFLIFLF